MISPEAQLQAVKKLLDQCRQGKFWGKVTLQLSAGNLIEMQATQTVRVKEKTEDVLCVNQEPK